PAFDLKRLIQMAIVGAADEGLRLAELCDKHEIWITAICDDDPKKHGMKAGTITVKPVDALQDVDRDVPVIVASHRVLKALERLKGMGFRHVAPFALLEVLDPKTFPPHMFYDGWLEDLFEHRGRYAALAGL